MSCSGNDAYKPPSADAGIHGALLYRAHTDVSVKNQLITFILYCSFEQAEAIFERQV